MRTLRTTVSRFGLLAAALVLAAAAGVFTAIAVGTSAQEPTRTVTIEVGGLQGPAVPTGPQGPPGPPGPAGTTSCPSGYTFGAVVFNTPGGHQQIATCLRD